MMRRRLRPEQLPEAIAAVADDGFATAAELHPRLPRVSRRDPPTRAGGPCGRLAGRAPNLPASG
ncbi:MAG TPA: hypothetical protein VGI73_00375 [Solirubrobacterales bacterium]|jgi:hypothetical protein